MIYYSRNQEELTSILDDLKNEPHFTAYAGDGSAAVFCPRRSAAAEPATRSFSINTIQLGFPRVAIVLRNSSQQHLPGICLIEESDKPVFISSDDGLYNQDSVLLINADQGVEIAIAEAAVLTRQGLKAVVCTESLDDVRSLSQYQLFPVAYSSSCADSYQAAVLAGADILFINDAFVTGLKNGIDGLDDWIAGIEDVAILARREFEYPYTEAVSYDKPGVFTTVAFQGTHGAYSEMAAKSLLGPCDTIPYPTFREAYAAVLSGEVEAAMIPVENSLGGSVHENYDILTQTPDVKIIGEVPFRIQHSLIGVKGATLDQIKEAYSHPQGLAQCKTFLEKHNIKAVPFYDTAGSAEYVAKEGDPAKAGIAHAGAADVYGARVIQEGIESNHKNFTRFFVIVRDNHPDPDNPQKASIVFSTRDEAGALLRCMQVLAKEGLNLSKLESRPIPGRPWSYMFYMDLDLPAEEHRFEAGISELKKICEDFKLLGIYPVYK